MTRVPQRRLIPRVRIDRAKVVDVGLGLLALTALAWMLATLVSTPGAASGQVRSTITGCDEASDTLRSATRGTARKAVRCLLNAERASQGRGRLAGSPHLQGVAQRHSNVMVAEACFEHVCPGEQALDTRFMASGYTAGHRRWEYSEHIGCGASASAMVAAWLAHSDRKTLLDASWDDVGVGVADASPTASCAEGDGTFTLLIASRD